jgi:integrase
MRRSITPEALVQLKAKLKSRRTPLTDKEVAALPPAAPGARYDIGDPGLAGFGVRLNDRGQGTFNLTTRYPGHTQPARREIGKVGEVTLAEARETARKWLALVKAGIDPKTEVERNRQAALRQQAHTFASVAELWLQRHASKLRSYRHLKRTVEVELIAHLGSRPVAEISRDEVRRLLTAIVDDGRPRQAHLVFEYLRSIFVWAQNQEIFGLDGALPTDRLKPKVMFGPRQIRTRFLDDKEIKAFWSASARLGYPHGPLFRLLMLTGCRLREIGGASWREIDRDRHLLTIPPERFKSGTQHFVPLSSTAMQLIDELPTFAGGDFVFTVNGVRPVENYGNAKEKLDKYMTEALGHEPAPFVLHDLRRTMRTRLASLRIPSEIAERAIGHGPKSQLQRIYDQHEYLDEVREALELWANRLRDITDPPPSGKVVRLDDARRA